MVVSCGPRTRTRGSSRRDEVEVDSGLDRNGGSLEAVGTLEERRGLGRPGRFNDVEQGEWRQS